ncbi:LOW QUALITY PROTEIN: leucine-rich repeat-containing protein 3C-like [Salarias fasciatus]|uniref:LOW QUALITY PROTEIN: leucine-rich repeat-containing protein 3C-like n=1 Tax=Salarias fasciatus TaxID=181472 RepID=UPI0011766DA2|nr:LOW QUALITY PROTEIN: leucine-rich repeat-containing protein 3C-like [Salarias fasciatus]
MTSSPLTSRRSRVPHASACLQAAMPDGGLTIPIGLSNLTTRLFLNKNLISSLPGGCFSLLLLLDELDLSHNKLSALEAGCFSSLAASLRYLDLSSNQLTTLDPAVFAGLQVQANLTQNPWHCDCRMQLSMPQLSLDLSSLSGVVCQTSDLPNPGAVGLSLLLLLEDWDLCLSVRRTTDVLTLVTMFLWFAMLLAYFLYYIRQNKVFARRHFDYLQFLQSRDPFSSFRPV